MNAAWHIVAALHVDCKVVIKPPPYTPLSTFRLINVMNMVPPPGVVNVVSYDADIGNGVSTHLGIDRIVFAGSTATGKSLMSQGADMLKRLTLELGGSDAGIILPETAIDPLL